MRWLVVCISMAACGSGERDITTFCALEYSCSPQDWDSAEACEANQRAGVDAAGGDCLDAVEERNACRADLDSCVEVAAYWDEPTEDYPCAAEDTEVERACISG